MNNLRKYTNFTKAELDKVSGVYLILNTVSNSAYIGESTNLYRRLNEHITSLLKNCHFNNHLQNSFNKHSITNFKFEILEFCSNTKEREHYYVTEFQNNNTFSTILNIKPTDPLSINLRSEETSKKIYLTKKKRAEERGYWLSKETIQKIFTTRSKNAKEKGYWHSEETKKNIGEKRKGKFKPIHLKKLIIKKTKSEYVLTEQTRKKISICHKGKILSEETKKKISIAHKGKKLKQETIEKLRIVNTGKKMSDDNRQKINAVIEKPVIQCNLDGVDIQKFKSISEATKVTGINSASIGLCCKGIRKSAGKYKWKLIKNENL
jgi:group I intron endonuclease